MSDKLMTQDFLERLNTTLLIIFLFLVNWCESYIDSVWIDDPTGVSYITKQVNLGIEER